MKSAPTIAFDYRPSRSIAALAASGTLAASAVPWLSGLAWPLCVAVSVFALVFGMGALHRFTNPPFRRIAFLSSGWTLIDEGGKEHPAIFESHVHLGALLVLGFRYGPRARFRAVLTPDNLDADTRRRLVLMLARADVVHGQ
jgi:hypothetical protein